jgi:rubrerythrin
MQLPMDAAVIARLDARRRALELVLLAPLAGCGPAPIDPVGDGNGTDGETGNAEGIDPPSLDMPPGDEAICPIVIDATGIGDCFEPLGYRWTTGGCAPVRGCACEGTECSLLYATRYDCELDYAHCDLCAPCPETMGCVVHCDGTGYTNDITCGVGCHPSETDYPCPMTDLEQPADVDGHCSGLGRVMLHQSVAAQRLLRREGKRDASSMAARAWARIASCEAASVDAFERLAQQLRVLGAPIDFITSAHEFADDERRHASATETLARRLDPEVDVPSIPERAVEMESLLEETVLEGCIGETLSALELEHMRARCSDEAIASMLARIAAEESRHAEHAWALLAWLLRRFPALRSTAAQLFDQPCSTIPLGLDRDLPEFGLLADSVREELWQVGRRHVVARLATRLLLLPSAPVERDANLC